MKFPLRNIGSKVKLKLKSKTQENANDIKRFILGKLKASF